MSEDKITAKAKVVLRDYLVRCHKIVSKDFPEIKDMAPENAADYLLHLKDTNRIQIILNTVGSQIKCKIVELEKEHGSNQTDGK